jgi:hypothetical protein
LLRGFVLLSFDMISQRWDSFRRLPVSFFDITTKRRRFGNGASKVRRRFRNGVSQVRT